MKEKKQQPDKSPEKKKKAEHLSRKDLEELMGMNMQVLTKKNGAWKRK